MSPILPSIQPHTKAKHEILQYHLEQWFPILGRTSHNLQVIDGFAGYGEYEGGEPGSPIIAMEAISGHSFWKKVTDKGGIVNFLFVDREVEAIKHLRRKIGEVSWPSAMTTKVIHDEFEHELTFVLDDLVVRQEQMPPTLAFIDPFGPAGFPMTLLQRLADYERVDVLINLNHREFVRWILPDPTKHITAGRLYGGPRWRPALDLEGDAQTEFLVREYEDALGEIGWRGTSFEMVDRLNQTAYHLIFGTGHPKGLEAIKRAMRKTSQTGEFRYTDRIDPAQPILLGLDMESEFPTRIGTYLFHKYEGQEITFEHLIENEINWHRWWLESDLRKGLVDLEYGDDQSISGVRNTNGKTRQRKSYPHGCFITFGRPPQARLL